MNSPVETKHFLIPHSMEKPISNIEKAPSAISSHGLLKVAPGLRPFVHSTLVTKGEAVRGQLQHLISGDCGVVLRGASPADQGVSGGIDYWTEIAWNTIQFINLEWFTPDLDSIFLGLLALISPSWMIRKPRQV